MQRNNLNKAMSTYIREFWIQNPDYWIGLGAKQREADSVVYEKFHNYNFNKDDDLGKIIYLDQFIRHFSRIETVSESFLMQCRQIAVDIVSHIDFDNLLKEHESAFIWYLMPLKHLQKYAQIFALIDRWLHGLSLTDFPILNRFFMDTYKKAYCPQTIAEKLVLITTPQHYDSELICEWHPPAYLEPTWKSTQIPQEAAFLTKSFDFNKKQPITVSLSGGVDSMLMTALLCRMNIDVIAVHIVYGNRDESIHERNFISTYCCNLGIPLYIYTIEWLRRDSTERTFYESMTREIRFSAYKALKRPVLLGHIQEDVVENIWTNIGRGTNLDNLAKFSLVSTEREVTIYRPWLNVKKSLIYQVAESLSIPYLKNTTPSWSNRGKFREKFYQATQDQYGSGVDSKLIEVAERFKKQTEMLNKLLFQKIIQSWDEETKTINITNIIDVDLDGTSWQIIFTDLAHNKLRFKKPSFSACNDFAERVSRGLKHGQKIMLSKEFSIEICMKQGGVFIKF